MIYFTPRQLPLRVVLLLLLIAGSFGWAMADAPTAITAPKALTSCRPTFSYGCYNGVNSFTLNSVALSTSSTNTGCPTSGNYTAFTAITTNVTPGQPYSLTGTFQNNNNSYATIWGDLNRNGVFESTELLFQSSQSASNFRGILTVPPGTATGSLDIRLMMTYYDRPNATAACSSINDYGETEDYVLNVITPTAYNPTTTGVGSTSAVLLWNNLGTASTYDLQWRQMGGTYTTISGITSTSYALTGLTLGTAYDWQMQPTGGSYVGPVSFTTAACATPTSLNAYNIGSASVQYLSWSSSNEVAYPNKTYEVQLQVTGAGSWSTVYTGTGTQTPKLTGLALQTPYTWRVRATCSVSSVPQTFTTTACNAPVPSTNNTSYNSAVVSWNDNENTAYNLQYRPVGSTTWTTVSSLTGNQTYSLTGLTGNTTYEYAINKVCTSSISSTYATPQTFTTTCNALLYPSTNPSLLSAQLTWYTPALGNPPATIVQLQWRPTSQSVVSWTTVDNLAAGSYSNSYSLTGLTSNTGYQWQARLSCGTGVYSGFTSPLSFTTASCQPPYSLFASSISVNRTTLQWYASASYAGQQYTLQYRPASSSTITTGWVSVTGLSSAIYLLTGLNPLTAYECRVNSSCTPTEVSGFSSPVSFTTLPCTNTTYNLGVNNLAFSSAQLVWNDNAPTNIYALQWRPKTVPVSAWNTTTDGISNFYSGFYSLTGLSGNTVYEYQVAIACTPTQSSTYAGPYSFTTVGCLVPTSLYTYGIGLNQATLTWNGGNAYPGQSFTVQYRPASLSATSTGWTSVSGLTTNTFSLTGLDINTAYQCQVSQLCSATDASGFTTPLTFSTLPCTNAVYGLNVSNQTFMSAQLNWYDNTTNTYTVQWRPKTTPAANWNTIASAVTSYGGSYTLTSLNTTTAYEFQVAIVCTPSLSSTYAGPSSFTTTACSNLATGLTATGTTFSAANLTWTGPSFGNYALQYRVAGTTPWTTVSGIMSKPYTLTGLTASTVYEAQLASVCSGSATVYGLTASFTTATCTNAASSLTALTIGSTTATLGWNSPPGVGSSLQYRVGSSGSWQTVAGVVTAPYVLTNLTFGTAYQFQVASVCGAGQLSAYSTVPGSFTTVDPNACTTMQTVKDGSWNDPTVWSCNRVPLVTDAIQLKHQVTVPNGYLAYSLSVSFDVGSKLIYGAASRLQLSQ